MAPLSVVGVIGSAIAHVYWNYQIKRSPAPIVDSWWVMALGSVIAIPIAALRLFGVAVAPPLRPSTTATAAILPADGLLLGLSCILCTGAVYAVYFWLIGLSYEHGELSKCYPIARGVAPLATAIWGVLWLHETPSPGGWTGILLVTAGVVAMAVIGLTRAGVRSPDLFAAVATGLCTSAYSAIDKIGVQVVPPEIYIVCTFGLGSALHLVLLLRRYRWREFLIELGKRRRTIVTAACCSMGGYLLILWILRVEPVSYVVPIRSIAVVFSVLAGTRLLGEKEPWRRLAAAALVLAGITTIAVKG